MQALSKISDIISQLKKKKEEDDEDVDISDLEIIFMKILNVLKTGLEEEKARFATERMFQEEKDYEDEKRHEEFLAVLKQFVSMQPMEKPEEDKKTSGILDFFKNLIETLKNFFKTFLIPKLLKIFGVLKNVFMKTIENVGKLIKKIGSWIGAVRDFVKKLPWGNIFKSIGRVLLNLARFAGPIGLIITAIVGLSYLLDKLAKNIPDMSLLGNYKEAESVLTRGTQRDIEYFANKIPKEYLSRLPTSPDITAKEKLEFFVREAKSDTIKNLRQKKASGTITPDEEKELNKLMIPSVLPAGQVEPDKINPRPPFEGVGARWNQWNQQYFRDYNPDGIRRTMPTNEPIPTTQDELKKRKEQEGKEQTKVQQTATPVRTDTPITELNRKQEEINTISQVLTKRIKELQENKRSLNESVYKERDQKKRIEIINQTKKVEEELTLREKQLRDLQRGIIPQDVPRSSASLLPQTMTPEDVVPNQSAAETERLKRYNNKKSEVDVGTGRSAGPGGKTFSEQLKEAQELGWPDSDELPPHNWAPMGKPLGRGSFISPSLMDSEPTARTVIADKGSIDTIPRPEEPQLAAPVQQPNVITNRFNIADQENRMLELTRTMAMNQTTSTGPIVNNVGKTEVIPDVPLSVEASQRDDTHTLSVVLSRYKRAYV